MKRIFLLIILIPTIFTAFAQEDDLIPTAKPEKELPRSVFMSYRRQADALIGDRDSSLYYSNLNGDWKFQMYPSAAKVPGEVTGANYDISKWKTVKVPQAWELAGEGTAVYAEKAYDFAKEPPAPGELLTDIPTAVYSCDFSVPFDYMDKALFVHFGAAKAAIRVFVNGKEMGYSEDSKNPAEFDITKVMVRGRNRLTVLVSQWSEGSFLEGQSMWRLSGFNREVYLFCQPKIRVRDFIIRTTLDPTYRNGLLETAMLLKTQLINPHTVTVHYDLYDPQGNLVNADFKDVRVGLRGEDTVRFTASIPDVKKWNAETPELYTILYRIKREGRWTECIAVKAGFRTVEIKEGELLLNGQPLTIKGVNLGEHTLKGGNYMDEQSVRGMLRQMKLCGINAIRTDGYPLPPHFYKLCDELGFYVCDVANINSQGMTSDRSKGGTLANDPAWCKAFVDRVNNTYERGKVHPSVIMVALGDRAGNGYNMYQAYLAIKEKEDTRPVVYDDAWLEWNSDIFCPAFPKADQLSTAGTRKPVIPSRVEYDPVYWNTPGIQGAFLDRWETQDLNVSGAKYARLGDDYKPTPQNNGTVGAKTLTDQKGDLSPKMKEISGRFAPVVIRPVDGGKGVYEFENRLEYTNLDRFEVAYKIMNGNKVSREGVLNVSADPGEKAQVTIPGVGGLGNKGLVITVGNLARYESN